MYRQYILWGISEMSFEIPDKIPNLLLKPVLMYYQHI